MQQQQQQQQALAAVAVCPLFGSIWELQQLRVPVL
jgi:hypothetical protein